MFLATTHPTFALHLRRRLVAELLSVTNAHAYPAVARHVAAMRDISRASGRAGECTTYHAEVCAKHRAKRNLMALLKPLGL